MRSYKNAGFFLSSGQPNQSLRIDDEVDGTLLPEGARGANKSGAPFSPVKAIAIGTDHW